MGKKNTVVIGGQVRSDGRSAYYDAQRSGEPKEYVGLPEIADEPKEVVYISNPKVLKKHRELRKKREIP